MNAMTKANLLQAYQVIVYSRALHPEHFPLRGRRVHRRGAYELEAWVMPGQHVLRFTYGAACVCELVTDAEKSPVSGMVSAFLAAGERDFEHKFEREKFTYMTTVQTENLAENLYAATYDEILELAREKRALHHAWEDEQGKCLSVIDVIEMNKEVHAECYHLVASGGVVVRTQTLFEHR
jgi:hypothetical protein